MPERQAALDAFLDRHGWGDAERGPLAGDASFRRYDRLDENGRLAVLMDAPPPAEDVRPFVLIARHLIALGLSAPDILAEDTANGFLLLDDLGDRTFTRELAAGGDERALYKAAVDVLIHLYRLPTGEVVPAGLPAYDDDLLWHEASLLVDWYLPAVHGKAAGEAERQAFRDAWAAGFRRLRDLPPTLVLRDYHVDNLMWLPEHDGVRACGLLDFQDAVAGSPAYDLMSLLEDARRDVAADLKADMRRHYLDAFPNLDHAAFDDAFQVLAAQRHAKVIGIFTRLCHRDGKADYLGHIPRLWRLLEDTLAHPLLAPVAAWLDKHLPADIRRMPPADGAAT